MDTLLQGLFALGVIAILFGSLLWVATTITEYGFSTTHKVISVVVAVIVWSLFLGNLIKYESEHPCLKYETQVQYNPATKTMMPMKVCVERGEWVEE